MSTPSWAHHHRLPEYDSLRYTRTLAGTVVLAALALYVVARMLRHGPLRIATRAARKVTGV